MGLKIVHPLNYSMYFDLIKDVWQNVSLNREALLILFHAREVVR